MTSPFATFLSAIGHRVVTTSSGEWFNAGPRFFLSLPFHRVITPDAAELRQVMRDGRGLGARFVAPLNGPGRLSYQIVCDERSYDVERLSPNTRSKVRRGLRRCRVERVECGRVARDGRQAHLDTMQRQDRAPSDGAAARQHWERYWAAAAQTPGMEAWGAFVDDQLAAYLLTVQLEDRCEFLLARSCNVYLGQYPNNALIYTVARAMLERPTVAEITFGLESLEPVDALDQFKVAMGFRHRPLRQRIVVRPGLAGLLRVPTVGRVVRWYAERPGVHPGWRKLAGIIDFMREDSTPMPWRSDTQPAH
jgi:hypothetical protein